MNSMLLHLTRRRLTPLTQQLTHSLSSSFSVTIDNEDDPPFSLLPEPHKTKRDKQTLNPEIPPISQISQNFPVKPDLPFDFRHSYSESDPARKPIGFRDPPRFSPFGLGRVDRKWDGTCAAAEAEAEAEGGGGERERRWEEERRRVMGGPLSEDEIAELVEKYRHSDCNRQIGVGEFALSTLFC